MSSLISNDFVIDIDSAKTLDKLATLTNNIPPIVLMEEAASKLFMNINADYDLATEKICIIAGNGNNGGDALALARYLLFAGIPCDIYIFHSEHYSELNLIQQQIIKSITKSIFFVDDIDEHILSYTLIIDGIFGIGYTPRDNSYELLFGQINRCRNSKCNVIAIDVPSGIDSANKYISVIADITYSIGFDKSIFYNTNTRNKCGNIKNIKISFDINNIQQQKVIKYNNMPQNTENHHRIDARFCHKYKRGSVCCIGGSIGKLGSIVFAGSAAMSIGAGIVLGLSEVQNLTSLNVLSKSIIFDSINNIDSYLNNYNTVLIGPGLHISDSDKDIIYNITNLSKKFVLDASFFTTFGKDILTSFASSPILTPHLGEFTKFFGDEAKDVNRDTIGTVTRLAIKYNCYIVFKDSFMFLATPQGDGYVFDSPNKILAQAGSGDILSGMIAGLLSQGYSQVDACIESIKIFYDIAQEYLLSGYRSYNTDEFIDKIRSFV